MSAQYFCLNCLALACSRLGSSMKPLYRKAAIATMSPSKGTRFQRRAVLPSIVAIYLCDVGSDALAVSYEGKLHCRDGVLIGRSSCMIALLLLRYGGWRGPDARCVKIRQTSFHLRPLALIVARRICLSCDVSRRGADVSSIPCSDNNLSLSERTTGEATTQRIALTRISSHWASCR